MKIQTCGAMRRRGGFISDSVSSLKKHLYLLEGKDVKIVKLIFRSSPPCWDIGFSWLWDKQSKVVSIVISPPFLTHYRARWLIHHELLHSLILIEGRMRAPKLSGLVQYRSKGKKKMMTYFFDHTINMIRCQKTNKLTQYPPWEEEVWAHPSSFKNNGKNENRKFDLPSSRSGDEDEKVVLKEEKSERRNRNWRHHQSAMLRWKNRNRTRHQNNWTSCSFLLELSSPNKNTSFFDRSNYPSRKKMETFQEET